MTSNKISNHREGFCPVYDIACPAGTDAATSCDKRFSGDYNPLTSFRDSDIEHCAIYRQEQAVASVENQSGTDQTKKTSSDGEK